MKKKKEKKEILFVALSHLTSMENTFIKNANFSDSLSFFLN